MIIFIIEGNQHDCYFIPCTCVYVLKRPAKGEVGIKRLQFKNTRKRDFFSSFVSKRKDAEKSHLTGHCRKVLSIAWVNLF